MNECTDKGVDSPASPQPVPAPVTPKPFAIGPQFIRPSSSPDNSSPTKYNDPTTDAVLAQSMQAQQAGRTADLPAADIPTAQPVSNALSFADRISETDDGGGRPIAWSTPSSSEIATSDRSSASSLQSSSDRSEETAVDSVQYGQFAQVAQSSFSSFGKVFDDMTATADESFFNGPAISASGSGSGSGSGGTSSRSIASASPASAPSAAAPIVRQTIGVNYDGGEGSYHVLGSPQVSSASPGALGYGASVVAVDPAVERAPASVGPNPTGMAATAATAKAVTDHDQLSPTENAIVANSGFHKLEDDFVSNLTAGTYQQVLTKIRDPNYEAVLVAKGIQVKLRDPVTRQFRLIGAKNPLVILLDKGNTFDVRRIEFR